MPELLNHQYRQRIHYLLNLPWNKIDGKSKPYTLLLDSNARSIWKALFDEIESQLGSDGELNDITDWAGKLAGHIARIAAILHCASVDTPHERHISASIMTAAVSLAKPLIAHARAAHELMGNIPNIECAKRLLKWVQRERKAIVTQRDAYEKVKGTYPDLEQVKAGIKTLEDRAYLFPFEKEARKLGRPSAKYLVNPMSLLEENKGSK